MPSTAAHIGAVFFALSKPDRLAIFLLIAEGVRRPSEMADGLKLPIHVVHTGLRRLAVGGLVMVEKFHSPREYEYRLHASVKVTDDDIRINAGGFPITIGRELVPSDQG